jgi:hypothetical protein
MRGILHADSLFTAVIGAAVLAVLVQLVGFLCTSGFTAPFTRILTLRELDSASYYGYLRLYNAAYTLDDIAILSIGVLMLSRHRFLGKRGPRAEADQRLVMMGLGVYLAFFA